jgi:hypothetical protein
VKQRLSVLAFSGAYLVRSEHGAASQRLAKIHRHRSRLAGRHLLRLRQALADILNGELGIRCRGRGYSGADPQHHPYRKPVRRARADHDGHRI